MEEYPFDIHFHIENDVLDSFKQEGELLKLCQQILIEEEQIGDVNIILTNDAHVRLLNLEFRKKDKTTDVLSFPWNDEDILGEIYISVPQVARQAPRFENSFENEFKRMFIHGLLHLCAYDHMKPDERKEMRTREEEILGWKIY